MFLNLKGEKHPVKFFSVPFAPKLLSYRTAKTLAEKENHTIFLKGRDSPLHNLLWDEVLSLPEEIFCPYVGAIELTF